jgi:hypothetical protein
MKPKSFRVNVLLLYLTLQRINNCRSYELKQRDDNDGNLQWLTDAENNQKLIKERVVSENQINC